MTRVLLRQIGKKAVSVEVKEGLETAEHFTQYLSEVLKIPASRLRLVWGGKPLTNSNYSRLPDFKENDLISYAVALRAPEEYLREKVDGGFEEQEERDLRFDVSALSSSWQRRLAIFLRNRFKFSDTLLSLLFAISPRGYAILLVWFLGGKVFHSYEFGPVYLVSSIIAFILLNLGERREGEASAYSIFNNFEALPGTLTNEQLERQMIGRSIT